MKVVLFTPFWGQPQHVGVYRIDRFIRWLSARGTEIVLVRAGEGDLVIEKSWGVEVTVRDPLRLHPESPVASGGGSEVSKRQPNRLRRIVAYALFNPDPTVAWARRAAHHPAVLAKGAGADWVLSSSPPESAHVGAADLAQRLGSDLVIDMRDGWLDEPLKSLLQWSRFQRWREGWLERRVLQRAKRIFVTSQAWKNLLEDRVPVARGKIIVLTNGYPPDTNLELHELDRPRNSDRVTLLHAGRFSGSSMQRRVGLLLEPIFRGIQETGAEGDLCLLGGLGSEDMRETTQWKSMFEAQGWSLSVQPPIARQEMMLRLNAADGLLLLSASQAAIPSKLFEYIATGKPILALCPKESAVWTLCADLPQVFLSDYRSPRDEHRNLSRFMDACRSGTQPYIIPEEFSEESLSNLFLTEVGLA